MRFLSNTLPGRFFAMTAALSATGMLTLAVLGTGARATRARQAALPLDHFTCYQATFSSFQVRKVGLADQFGKSVAVVSQPLRLCSPVSKNGQSLVNPRAHLVCYPIKLTPQFQARKVLVKNQFGSQTMTVARPETLCMPSSKATTGTPGPIPTTLDHYTCYAVDPSGTFKSRVVKLCRSVRHLEGYRCYSRESLRPYKKARVGPRPRSAAPDVLSNQVGDEGSAGCRPEPVRHSEKPADPPSAAVPAVDQDCPTVMTGSESTIELEGQPRPAPSTPGVTRAEAATSALLARKTAWQG